MRIWKWFLRHWAVVFILEIVWALWGLVQIHVLGTGPNVMIEILTDPHFLSGFYVVMATLGICVLVQSLIKNRREKIKSRLSILISELSELASLAERIQIQRARMDEPLLTVKDAARSRVLYRKYQSWLPGTEIGKPETYHYKAVRCVELLKVYGYAKGLQEISRKSRNG